MKFLDNAEFRTLAKQRKAISDPIRKSLSAPVQMLGPRQAKFKFSSPSPDREYDVVKQAGIDVSHFTQNPVIFWGHEHDSLPIGKCVDLSLEGGCLTGVIEFAPADNAAVGAKAQGIFELVRDGFLSTVSIGFIPKSIDYPEGDRLSRDGVDVLESELVEVSIVGIPCNRDAMVQGVGVETTPVQEAPQPPVQVAAASPSKRLHAARMKRLLAVMD